MSPRKKNPVVDPAHERAIERHKRIVAYIRSKTPPPIESDLAIGPLKLSRNVMLYLEQHVIGEFNRRAAPAPREARCIESGIAAQELLVEVHADTYAKAIQWAVGEFADVLTQTLTTRTTGRDISETVRAALWDEALRFADYLTLESVWSTWLEHGDFPVANFGESGWTEQNRQTFFRRVGFSRTEWLFEVDRRINVRLILCGAKQTIKRVERRRQEIAKLMYQNRGASDRDLCLRIDALNEAALNRSSEIPCPVPAFLKNSRLWADAFNGNNGNIAQKMHEYLSKIRGQFRISQLPNLP
jgi:hypothetical protein